MKNFGHADLRIVGDAPVLPGEAGHAEARALAWNAGDVLDHARRFDTLAGAIADLHLAAAATSRAEIGRDALTPRALALEVARLPAGARAGVVLGREDKGLTNLELDLCRTWVRIPAFGEQPSLNLAQAAVVLAYEAGLAGLEPDPGAEPPATEADVERLVRAGESLLLRAGYLNPAAPEHVLGELRRLLARARPSEREVRLLQGLVSQLDWAHRNRP